MLHYGYGLYGGYVEGSQDSTSPEWVFDIKSEVGAIAVMGQGGFQASGARGGQVNVNQGHQGTFGMPYTGGGATSTPSGGSLEGTFGRGISLVDPCGFGVNYFNSDGSYAGILDQSSG